MQGQGLQLYPPLPQPQATPPHTYASERVVRAVIEAMPLGSGGSKCRDTARGRVGAARRPGAEGALPVASQTGSLTTHFQLHGGLGRGVWGGGARVSTVATGLPEPGFKMRSGTPEWPSSSTPPPRLLPGFLHRGAGTAGVREQGSQCALTCSAWGVTVWSVWVHIQFQEGLKFMQLGVNRITLTSTSPLSTVGAEEVTPGGQANPASTGHGTMGTSHKIANTALSIPSHSPGSP